MCERERECVRAGRGGRGGKTDTDKQTGRSTEKERSTTQHSHCAVIPTARKASDKG